VARDEVGSGTILQSKISWGCNMAEGTLVLRTVLLEVVGETTLEAMEERSLASLSSKGRRFS